MHCPKEYGVEPVLEGTYPFLLKEALDVPAYHRHSDSYLFNGGCPWANG